MIRRLVLFTIFSALLITAAVWMASRPGEVMIRWQGWRVDTTVPVLVVAVLAVMAALTLIWRLVRAIIRLPAGWLANRRSRRMKDGYRALSDGLAAVAAGDGKRARKLAHRADKLLEDQALTGLLGAQAAELAGDDGEAHDRLIGMAARPETALLGHKGLLAQALKRGDQAQALEHARQAWGLGGGGDLALTLFDLQAKAGLWTEAETTLDQAKQREALTGGQLTRLKAITFLEQSRRDALMGDYHQAARLADKARRADIMVVGATVQLAAMLHRQDKARRATSAILTAWQVTPHPALVEAYLALASAETPLQRVKRLEKLVKVNPDAVDGHIALGEAALNAKLWGQARTHLTLAANQRAGAAVFFLLAKLEHQEHQDEQAAQAWLAQGAAAPQDPAWICGHCGHKADQWSAICPQCGEVDRLEWRTV